MTTAVNTLLDRDERYATDRHAELPFLPKLNMCVVAWSNAAHRSDLRYSRHNDRYCCGTVTFTCLCPAGNEGD
jgi:hypothetical protein